MRDQRGGGGFAVRAGDGDELAAQKAPGQLDFAPHRDAFGARVFQRLDFRRDARADHDQILLEKSLGNEAAEFELHSGHAEFFGGFAQFREFGRSSVAVTFAP